MRITRYPFVSLTILFLLAGMILADEGMWPVQDIHQLDLEPLRERGLELTADEIYSDDGGIARAVVKLNGSSSSFVSPTGLIMTNHHVALGIIRQASTVENNYIRDGFHARTQEEEYPALGSVARVLLETREVTDVINDAIEGIDDPQERHDIIDRLKKEMIAEAEKDRDVACEVRTFGRGDRYELYTYFKIKDIRLVFAPPEGIGNYGDEIDNWMWPRHVCDFTILRAYVAPDGGSAQYSKDNIPYHPDHYLKISANGVVEGDLAILLGFPGSTNRFVTPVELEYTLTAYRNSIERMSEQMAMYEAIMASDPEAAIKLRSSHSGLSNYSKKYTGILRNFERGHLLELQQRKIDSLIAYLKEHPIDGIDSDNPTAVIDSLTAEEYKYYDQDIVLKYIPYRSRMLSNTTRLHKWLIEREKPDLEREYGYQDRDSATFLRDIFLGRRSYIEAADKAMLIYHLEKAITLPEDQRIEPVHVLFAGVSAETKDPRIVGFVDELYASTRVGDSGVFTAWYELSLEEYEALADPMVQLAVSLRPYLDRLQKREEEIAGALAEAKPAFIQAMRAYQDKQYHPDANSTMRLNFGTIKGYSPEDGVWYEYITSLSGVIAKHTGVDPFIVPDELKQVYHNRDFAGYIDANIDDVPVNFLTTNDGTNGNSGSPVVNGRGEFIGIDFDSNFDGVAKDLVYYAPTARAIVTDARYILFILDKVYNASAILDEMEIIGSGI